MENAFGFVQPAAEQRKKINKNMEKGTRNVVLAVVGSILALVAAWALLIRTDSTNNSVVFYYSDTCPHCANVEKYISEKKVEEKIKFVKKEVSKDQRNATEMAKRAADCGLDQQTLGVPFLFDGQKCYEGEDDVINFFSSKL